MAAYKVIMARGMLPYRYLESDGSIADHETPHNELAVNERGGSKEAFQLVSEGDILYTGDGDDSELQSYTFDGQEYELTEKQASAKASYNKLSKKQKDSEDHEVIYCPNNSYVGQHTKLGTFEKLFDTPSITPTADEVEDKK